MLALWQKIETALGRKVDWQEDEVVVTDDKIIQWNAPERKPSIKELNKITKYINPQESDIMRRKRDRLIAETDWTQLPDASLNEDKKSEYAKYRKELRDITLQAGFPNSVQFPIKPSK